VAASTRVLGPSDINRTGIPSLTGAILDNIPSVTVNDAEGNAFQPDILFRGFTASPVAGTPQGIAIFVNGERFNDAFGDTVNWDLIPPSAIQSATLEAANPVFGYPTEDRIRCAHGQRYGLWRQLRARIGHRGIFTTIRRLWRLRRR
jgi:iron complex outermembrane receptor protein